MFYVFIIIIFLLRLYSLLIVNVLNMLMEFQTLSIVKEVSRTTVLKAFTSKDYILVLKHF